MAALFLIIIATVLISFVSLVGVFLLSFKEEFLNKILLKLVALSSGALLGGAFIHLIPEGLKKMEAEPFLGIILISLILYLIIEKLLHWHHCHKGPRCPIHTFGYMNLIGDAVHNFIDGLIIASTFIINIPLGITTAIAIILHEIPQEISDFGVLLYAGFEKKKAIAFNLLVSLAAVLGGLVGWILFIHIESVTAFLLPIAAGGFLYIALSDMIPELRKERNLNNFFIDLTVLLAGIALMILVKFIGA